MADILDLYRQMLSIRRGEELIAELYKQQPQPFRTPVHLAVGQEAIAVGVCAALDLKRDKVFSGHRAHAHYLACGGSYEALVAELYGSEAGCSRGRGGSVHLTMGKDGPFVASSAILTEMVAVATGAALAFKMDGSRAVAVSFSGDASMEEGAFYESMNYASLMKLGVVFVIENNGYSTESPLHKRYPEGTELTDRAVTFRVGAFKADGNDVSEVHKVAKQAIFHARGGQPVLIECATYRHKEHVGPHFDYELNRTYRHKSELDSWLDFDPLKIAAAELDLSEVELASLDAEIQAGLRSAAERAKASPMPDKSTLFEGVW